MRLITRRRRATKGRDGRKTLTDIVVALPLAELLSQSERGETLELLGELLRGVRSERVAALPSHLVVRLRLAGQVVLALHHVEHVALGVQLRHLALGVMGADDVQVVIEPHFHGVAFPMEPAGEVQRADGLFRCLGDRSPWLWRRSDNKYQPQDL